MSVAELRDVAQIISGQHLLDGEHNVQGKGVGYLTGPADFGVLQPTISRWTERPKAFCEPGDVLVTVKGAGVGKVNMAPNSTTAIGRQLMAVRSNLDRVDAAYLFAFLSAQVTYFQGRAVGATVPGLSRSDLEELVIPLQPLPEQRRIAACLKAQLAEVETARQAAQEQLKDIALLRSRVLQTAFDELANIPMRPLGDWVISYRNGFGRRPGTDETGPIVLRIADVSSGTIDLSNPRRGSVSPKEAETYRLEPNDLLFVRVNGARHIVGRCCVVDTDIPSDTIFNDHLIRVCLKPGINPEFARFCASSLAARALIEEAASTSAGQLTINQQVIASINVPDLLVTEQCRFVLQMESQFTEIEALESANKKILNKLELLPQRLLAQAFEKEED